MSRARSCPARISARPRPPLPTDPPFRSRLPSSVVFRLCTSQPLPVVRFPEVSEPPQYGRSSDNGQGVDLPLEGVEEAGGMGAVHLRVVELERDGERRFKEPPPVAAPDQERIVEHAAVHAHGPVDRVLRQRRGADHHAVCQVVVLARLGDLPREPQVVVVEAEQIIGKRKVARADLAPPVGDDGIDRDCIVPYQLVADRQHIELLDAACSTADAPAHQHVELLSFPARNQNQTRHIERPEKRHHRHGRLHPHLKGIGAGRLFRIYFFHTFVLESETKVAEVFCKK